MLRRASELLPGLAFILVLLATLEYVVRSGAVRAEVLPPPTVIGARLWEILSTGAVLAPLGSTLSLFFGGLLVSTLVGVGAGLAMGRSTACFNLLEPLVEAIRPMPKAALLPILMLFLGIGTTMKITSIVLATAIPILTNTLQGVRGVDPVLIATGRTFGRSEAAITLRIVLPAALPYILSGIRIGVGLALVVTILAEMLAGNGGLGYLIIDEQRRFRSADMYAWLVILAMLGLLLTILMNTLERHFVPWLETRP